MIREHLFLQAASVVAACFISEVISGVLVLRLKTHIVNRRKLLMARGGKPAEK